MSNSSSIRPEPDVARANVPALGSAVGALVVNAAILAGLLLPPLEEQFKRIVGV